MIYIRPSLIFVIAIALWSYRMEAQAQAFSISGDSIDKLRVEQLAGRAPLDGIMLRSVSSLTRDSNVVHTGFRVTRILPEFNLVGNNTVPYSMNDGALWAGRGINLHSMSGFGLSWWRLKLIALPEVLYSSNNSFETNTGGQYFTPTPRPVPWGELADPWYIKPYSADVPRRFGTKAIYRIVPGQSSLWATFGTVEGGVSTENNWWGPAQRNAIVMSNNAEGFPHLFLRSARPLKTMAGTIEWRWLVGGLTESDYFDDDASNDTRSISALAVTLRPSFEPNLTLGAARSVYGTADGWSDVPGRWFDVFRNTGHPADRPASDSSLYPGGKDQIISLFARWVFPKDGFEVYTEWARQELPKSLRDFFADPTHSHGYTTGFQWVRPAPAGANTVRLQGEVTTLEQSPSFRNRPVGVFYTSRRVIQGYTNKGQPIGAGIGPGSSAQWLAFDWLTGNTTLGPYLTRIRFNEDVRSTYPWEFGKGFCNHDVTTKIGVRGSKLFGFGFLGVDASTGKRRNAFFQNRSGCVGPYVVDAPTRTLSITFRPGASNKLWRRWL